MPLGCEKWENFSKVVDKAMLACDVAGFEIKHKMQHKKIKLIFNKIFSYRKINYYFCIKFNYRKIMWKI